MLSALPTSRLMMFARREASAAAPTLTGTMRPVKSCGLPAFLIESWLRQPFPCELVLAKCAAKVSQETKNLHRRCPRCAVIYRALCSVKPCGLPGRRRLQKERRNYETFVLLIRSVCRFMFREFGRRPRVEAAHLNEEAAEWPDRSGFRRSFRADIWNMRQLPHWVSSGAGRPHRFCASFRTHDVRRHSEFAEGSV